MALDVCDYCHEIFFLTELHLVKVPKTIDTFLMACINCDVLP